MLNAVIRFIKSSPNFFSLNFGIEKLTCYVIYFKENNILK